MKVLLCCGGTGGHIYPALALAEKLTDCFFIGSHRLEKDLIPKQGYKFYEIEAHARNILKLGIGFFQALKIIWREKPDKVISTGGYVTIPVLLASLCLGRPVYIQEQNLLPGKVNRFLSFFAKKVFATYEGSLKYFPYQKTVITGNPLRTELLKLNYDPAKSFILRTVLVFGGSLAARSINEKIFQIQQNKNLDFKIIHLDGKNYCHNMAEVYRQATLIVCRAGATSLAELAAIGLPAILIPYPYAADNHQELNARYFEANQAAAVILDKDLDLLEPKIRELLSDQSRLARMSQAMQKLAKKNAVSLILDQL